MLFDMQCLMLPYIYITATKQQPWLHLLLEMLQIIRLWPTECIAGSTYTPSCQSFEIQGLHLQ